MKKRRKKAHSLHRNQSFPLTAVVRFTKCFFFLTFFLAFFFRSARFLSLFFQTTRCQDAGCRVTGCVLQPRTRGQARLPCVGGLVQRPDCLCEPEECCHCVRAHAGRCADPRRPRNRRDCRPLCPQHCHAAHCRTGRAPPGHWGPVWHNPSLACRVCFFSFFHGSTQTHEETRLFHLHKHAETGMC